MAGTSSFYIDKGEGEPPALMADSGLSSVSELYNPLLDDSIGSVKAVSCSPEHLKLTYAVNFYTYWDKTSYFDLDLGTTVVAPGVDTRSYRFTPTIEVSTRNAILRPAVTAHKPAASAAHATVSTNEVTVEGAAKDTARFTMTARNDSTTVLSDFTISAGRVRGRAQAASVTCDLTAFGGEVVSATGPAESLTVSSGTAKVPQGQGDHLPGGPQRRGGTQQGQGRTDHRRPDLLQRLRQRPAGGRGLDSSHGSPGRGRPHGHL